MDKSLLLAAQLVEEEPTAAVTLLSEQSPENLVEFLLVLSGTQRLTILEGFPSSLSAACLELLDDEDGARWLMGLRYPFRSRVARALKHETLLSLIKFAPKSVARQIQKDVAFPRDRVGAWMEESGVAINEEETIAEVLERFRRMRRPADNTLIVTGSGNVYKGLVMANQLLSGSDKRKISDIADTTVRPLKADHAIPEIRFRPEWDTHLLLPVTGSRNRVLGVLKIERLKLALEQNTSESLSGGGMMASLLEAALITVAGIGDVLQNGKREWRGKQGRKGQVNG